LINIKDQKTQHKLINTKYGSHVKSKEKEIEIWIINGMFPNMSGQTLGNFLLRYPLESMYHSTTSDALTRSFI